MNKLLLIPVAIILVFTGILTNTYFGVIPDQKESMNNNHVSEVEITDEDEECLVTDNGRPTTVSCDEIISHGGPLVSFDPENYQDKIPTIFD